MRQARYERHSNTVHHAVEDKKNLWPATKVATMGKYGYCASAKKGTATCGTGQVLLRSCACLPASLISIPEGTIGSTLTNVSQATQLCWMANIKSLSSHGIQASTSCIPHHRFAQLLHPTCFSNQLGNHERSKPRTPRPKRPKPPPTNQGPYIARCLMLPGVRPSATLHTDGNIEPYPQAKDPRFWLLLRGLRQYLSSGTAPPLPPTYSRGHRAMSTFSTLCILCTSCTFHPPPPPSQQSSASLQPGRSQPASPISADGTPLARELEPFADTVPPVLAQKFRTLLHANPCIFSRNEGSSSLKSRTYRVQLGHLALAQPPWSQAVPGQSLFHSASMGDAWALKSQESRMQWGLDWVQAMQALDCVRTWVNTEMPRPVELQAPALGPQKPSPSSDIKPK